MIKKQRGVTLIELMISMVLGLGLIAGIGQIFIQSQKSFRLQRNVSDMTDDASFVLESLAKGILLAGYLDDPTTTPFILDDLPLDSTTVSLAANEFIHGTDNELIFRYELGNVIPVNGGLSIPDGCMKKSDGSRKGACELDNFVGTGALTGTKGDIITVRIYTKDDSGIPVFYSKSKVNATIEAAQPLISEVQKLVFRYGIKDSTNKFYYTDAGNVTDWTTVIAVKVFLVMRSADDNLVRTQTKYKFDGVEQDPKPTDHRAYKVFSKTIYLRSGIK